MGAGWGWGWEASRHSLLLGTPTALHPGMHLFPCCTHQVDDAHRVCRPAGKGPTKRQHGKAGLGSRMPCSCSHPPALQPPSAGAPQPWRSLVNHGHHPLCHRVLQGFGGRCGSQVVSRSRQNLMKDGKARRSAVQVERGIPSSRPAARTCLELPVQNLGEHQLRARLVLRNRQRSRGVSVPACAAFRQQLPRQVMLPLQAGLPAAAQCGQQNCHSAQSRGGRS